MINLQSVEQTYFGCGFVHSIVKQGKKQSTKTKPKQISLDKVTRCVERYGKVSRQHLIKKSGLSSFCIASCIQVLVKSGDLIETPVGKSGPYVLYAYSLPGET